MKFKQCRRTSRMFVNAIRTTSKNQKELCNEITESKKRIDEWNYPKVGDIVHIDEYGNWNVDTKDDFNKNFVRDNGKIKEV